MDFNGRVYVVTGAARGIGAGVFYRLHEDGAHVIGIDLRAFEGSPLEKQIGRLGDCDYIQADVSDPKIKIAADCLDGVVHCAGLIGPDDMHGGVSEENQRKIDAGHVGGFRNIMEICRALLNGPFVIMGSPATHGPLPAGYEMYATAKRREVALAQEYIDAWIDVRIVEPIMVRTEGVQELERRYAYFASGLKEMDARGQVQSVGQIVDEVLGHLVGAP